MKANFNLKKTFWIIPLLFAHTASAEVDCSTLEGKTLSASVSYVADGDTATVLLKKTGEKVKLRFYGVDTPESKWAGHWPSKPYSTKAKNFTVAALKHKDVNVAFTSDGTYSRCVGEIFIKGKSHSLALIKNGYAWWYARYAPHRSDSKEAQAKAKKRKLGLWADTNPQAPWDFRR